MKKVSNKRSRAVAHFGSVVYNTLTYPQNTLSAKVFEFGALLLSVFCVDVHLVVVYIHMLDLGKSFW